MFEPRPVKNKNPTGDVARRSFERNALYYYGCGCALGACPSGVYSGSSTAKDGSWLEPDG